VYFICGKYTYFLKIFPIFEFFRLLGYYAVWGLEPTFWDYLSVPSSKFKMCKGQDIFNHENVTDRKFRNVGLNHITPCNKPEDGRIQFNRGESLRSPFQITTNPI
jgi:hypothetical protein